MLSTGRNDFKKWTQTEQIEARTQFLNGEGLDKIGKNCHRHAKNVCLELIRQGLIQEEKSIATSHIRFETPYNLRYARKLEYDTSSEYTPSENDNESDSEGESEVESVSESLSDYDSTSDCESASESFDSGMENKIVKLSIEDFDIYDIKQQVDIVFDNVSRLRNYLKSFVK